jgi:Calcium binding
MAPEDACSSDMLVRIRWQSRNLAVPLSRLTAIDPDEATAEAIGDWLTGWHKVIFSENYLPPDALRSLTEKTQIVCRFTGAVPRFCLTSLHGS